MLDCKVIGNDHLDYSLYYIYHRHVEKNTENVGEKFADEARRIHYGEAEERGIRGVASDDEVDELAEENIDVYRLPTLPRTDA